LRPEGSDGGALPVRLESMHEALPGMNVNPVRFACESNGWQAQGLAPGSYRVFVGGSERFVLVSPGSVVVAQ
jgi:hypothetical protein